MPLGYQRAVQAQNRGLAGVPGRVGPGMYPPGYPYGGASPPPYPPSYAAGPGGVPVHGSSPSPPPHLARSDVGANQFAVPNGAPLKRGASMGASCSYNKRCRLALRCFFFRFRSARPSFRGLPTTALACNN
jgi:hypothetical protein